MQAVVGQFEHADIAPDFLAGHLRQGVELVQWPLWGREGTVNFQRRHLTAGAGALVAALARGPGLDGTELAPQRGNLAHAAALAMAVLEEAVQAFVLDQGLDLGGFRGEHVDGDAVMLAHLLDKSVGLWVQAAGIQAEDFDVLVQLPGHVHQHHVFGAAEGNP